MSTPYGTSNWMDNFMGRNRRTVRDTQQTLGRLHSVNRGGQFTNRRYQGFAGDRGFKDDMAVEKRESLRGGGFGLYGNAFAREVDGGAVDTVSRTKRSGLLGQRTTTTYEADAAKTGYLIHGDINYLYETFQERNDPVGAMATVGGSEFTTIRAGNDYATEFSDVKGNEEFFKVAAEAEQVRRNVFLNSFFD